MKHVFFEDKCFRRTAVAARRAHGANAHEEKRQGLDIRTSVMHIVIGSLYDHTFSEHRSCHYDMDEARCRRPINV